MRLFFFALKFINGSTTENENENEDEYIDEWMRRRNRLTSVSRSVRSSLIYSDMDGAVSKEAAVIEDDTNVENIKMHVSHVGFSHNPLVYWVIADRLAQAIDSWENFDVSMQPGTIQQYFHSSHD